MKFAIEIKDVSKTYENGFKALTSINLNVKSGEIFALLGPNGAGKTTLINLICGIVKNSSGEVKIYGFDHIKDYRKARSFVGLVPQELTTDTFEKVWNTIKFSRGLFGKKISVEYLENVLKQLALFEKKELQIRTLSGGMKRRVMIAKALSHEPKILFLDEPSAGVDVELRKSMWKLVKKLRNSGVTIILTTHYIEEAEEMADRVGVINHGKLLIIEEKKKLMKKFGKKELIISLMSKLEFVCEELKKFNLKLSKNKKELVLGEQFNDEVILKILSILKKKKIKYVDLNIRKNSLEDIFVKLIEK
ncbi:MAG: multidrug ABC transporter ATP-binding protein [Rickettsiales bacterium]|nr:multidrug ABC transporter ATP-binding protein [Rickettsiales bacterium]